MVMPVPSSSMLAPVLLLLPAATQAFVMVNPSAPTAQRPLSRLFLEDHIADMIDGELWRQGHKAEYEKEWMEKNRGAVLQSLGGGSGTGADYQRLMLDDREEFRQHAKDEKMAKNNPEKYCADRCLSTGNCDIYEDFFELGPEEVMKFCSDCVLSDGDEPCDIPEGFYDHTGGKLNP